MNLATWSIRNPVPTIVLFVLLTLAGLWGFHVLPIQNLPDLDLPTVNVTLTEPGAAPAQLETEVARRIEDSLATLSGLKHIKTSITDGQVSIVVEFVLEKPLSDALIETKDAVDRVRSELPPDLQQPTVSAVTIGGNAMMVYAISSPHMNEEALSWFVDDTVGKAILSVPGVGKFDRVGGVQREVRVQVDPIKLAAMGMTAADVSRALRQVQQQSSGGRGQVGGAEQSVRTIATVKQASELRTMPIAMPDGRHVRLDQVATVIDGIAERTQAALLNGKAVVGFEVYRANGSDETRIADGVRAALNRLTTNDPSLHTTQVSGSVGYTLEQYDGSMHMLYEGGLLAVIVVFFFLRDWRATLIAAAALPLSVLPAFAVMSWLGYSLNTLTLLALAVIIGILVDDAIVEIENIERHSRNGQTRTPGCRRCSHRDCVSRHGNHDEFGRGVFADSVHERRPRTAVQTIRMDRRHCGARLALGRAAFDATASGPFSENAHDQGGGGRPGHAGLHARHQVVPEPSQIDRASGRGVFFPIPRPYPADPLRSHPRGR